MTRIKSTVFLLLGVAAVTVFICLSLYLSDNKYTYSGPQASQGTLQVSEDDIKEHPVMILVDGWEFYRGELLEPGDFDNQELSPDEYIYIGEYGGFETGDLEDSPHGSVTYGLHSNF